MPGRKLIWKDTSLKYGLLTAPISPADFFDVVMMQADQELDRQLSERVRLEETRSQEQESTEAQEQQAVEELRNRP
jgi:hypothetical protein